MDVYRFLQKETITQIDPDVAKKRWLVFRQLNGMSGAAPLLAPPEWNMKTEKAQKKGLAVTMGLALAQSDTSGVGNVCRWATPCCIASCVGKNGGRRWTSAQRGAALRVKWLIADPSAFVSLMAAEIDAAYQKYGDDLQVRLNTFSDIPWEEIVPWLFSDRPHIRFYDYTKAKRRTPPPNYHLTFSASERTKDAEVTERVSMGQNVAVVFSTKRSQDLPETHAGCQVIDGDEHDARWLDPRGVIVGLRAKGSMMKDGKAMVRHVIPVV